MSDDIVDFLGKSRLFSGFSLEQLEQVVSHLQPQSITLKDGDRVYINGEPADRCWLIQSGEHDQPLQGNDIKHCGSTLDRGLSLRSVKYRNCFHINCIRCTSGY